MKKIDLTQGSILKVITLLALPIMGSSFLQLTYSLIDMIWVGRLGSQAVASIGASGLFIALGYAINTLVVTGTSIKVAHEVGRKQEVAIREYINAGLILNTMISIMYGLILLFFGKFFIVFLDIKNIRIEQDAYLYLLLHIPILFFAFFNMFYVRVLGSFGDTKSALRISGIGLVFNIILDPLWIYGFKLGVLGAAIATLCANIMMFILFNVKGKQFFRYQKEIGLNRYKFREILRLGTPMAVQRILFTLVGIGLAKMIAQFGAEAIAAQKIGLQIEGVAFMVVGGLSGAVASFVGQNYGAKNYRRIHQAYHRSLLIGGAYAALMAVIFFSIPEQLASLFVKDTITIGIASSYLRVLGATQIFSAVEMVSNGTFTGVGLPKIPATISIVFTVLRIPLALVLIPFWELDGIWISIALTSALKGTVAYLIYKFKVWKEYRDALSV